MERRHKIVTICGSTRFKKEFMDAHEELTLEGNVVLTVGYFSKDCETILMPETVELLESIHRQKIDMSDFIYVINKGGYIGESTRSEIEYAIRNEKPVVYRYKTI